LPFRFTLDGMEKKAANRASHFRDRLVIVVGLLVRKVIEDDGTITITTRVEVASPGQVSEPASRLASPDNIIPKNYGVTLLIPLVNQWGVTSQCRITRKAPVRTEPHPTCVGVFLGSFLVHLALGRHRLDDCRRRPGNCGVSRNAGLREKPRFGRSLTLPADGAPTRQHASPKPPAGAG
jgi:hypothetical protein